MHGPLFSTTFRYGDEHRLAGLQVVRSCPGGFDQGISRKQFSGIRLQDVEKAILRSGHGHATLFALPVEISHHDVIVLGMHSLGTGLIVPDVLASISVHSNNALREKFFAASFHCCELTVVSAGASGPKNHQTLRFVVGDRAPYVAAASAPTAFASPALGSHFQSFRFEWLGWIARYGPKAP